MQQRARTMVGGRLKLAAAVLGLALMAGACASTPAANTRPSTRAAAVPAQFAAPLRVCRGMSARRAGTVSYGSDVMIFSPVVASRAGDLLRNPTDGACLSSAFGWRGVATGGGRNHKGIDLARPSSRTIFAAGDGRVVHSGPLGSYGVMVRIDHGRGVETLYAHLDPSVTPAPLGSLVRRGQPVGRMGQTGRANGIHLHYEVFVDGTQVDPLRYGLPSAVTDFFGS